MQTISVYFDKPKVFNPINVKSLKGIVGLYFIFTQNMEIQYPFGKSRLLYIGMSEKKTNSIENRLIGHFDGKSMNIGLINYRKVEPLYFTYLNFDILKINWKFRIEDLESYFIMSFVENYGIYPICNNKTDTGILCDNLKIRLKIDWNYFKVEKDE